MIQEKHNTSGTSADDDFVRLGEDMEREPELNEEGEPKEDQTEDDQEPPLLSTVFAVDQLKNGAMSAASFFSWGFNSVKTQATALTETEQFKKFVDGAKAQSETISSGAAQFWENTKPQREEISRAATSLGEQMQPALDTVKSETGKALTAISSALGQDVNEPDNLENEEPRVRDRSV